jgi:predicted SAM-dependent methyltransferase
VKLNLACGPNVFPGEWINVDKADHWDYFRFIQTIGADAGMPDHQRKLWQWCQDGGRIEYVNDDVKGYLSTIASDSVDFIYSGQFLEHLAPRTEAPAFLRECLRVLKPGGVLRLTTPDLNKLLWMWRDGTLATLERDQPAWASEVFPEALLAYVLFGSAGKECSQEHYEGHQFCYSERVLEEMLRKDAGFREVTFTPPARPDIVDAGMSHSMVVEATK